MVITSSVGAGDSASAVYQALNGAAKVANASAVDNAQSRFLTLLTAQLKNQDPLNPVDNAQMTSQLAQMSTVDGIERLNATLTKLMDSQTQAQTFQAAALVGHSALVPGSGLTLAGGLGMAGIELANAADEVTIAIKDGNGLTIRTLNLGSQDAGVQAFGWDGKNDAGAQAVDGRYSFTVKASQGSDQVVTTRLEYGLIDSIVRQTNGLDVNVGSLGRFGIGEIRQIL